MSTMIETVPHPFKLPTDEQMLAVNAVLRAFHNVGSFIQPGDWCEWSICDFLRECNPDVGESYLEEKAALWRNSPQSFFGKLDAERAQKFVAWCLVRFGS